MTYRPPLSNSWKRISFFIIILLGIVVLAIVFQIISQKRHVNDLKKAQTSGILIDKKDLNRGNFLIVIESADGKKEYVLSGYDFYYNKFSIGDSLVQQSNSFQFAVYRKSNGLNFAYEYTIGYE